MTTTALPFDITTCEKDFAGPNRRVRVTGRQGFQVSFDNGWVISVQFGPGSYHTGRTQETRFLAPASPSIDAEVAAWKEDGRMTRLGRNTVAGWQSIENVQAALAAAERDDEQGIRRALTERAA
jgi:hypothetical protein